MALSLAFPKPEKQTKNKVADIKHRAFIHHLPCLSCGKEPSECHHLKRGIKRGMGMKAEDKFMVPLCPDCHRGPNGVEHDGNETEWFKRRQIFDPVNFALVLYDFYKDNNLDNAHDHIMRRFI